MLVISFGVRKSGSTLAFQMAKAVLELGGHPQPRLPGDLVKPQRPFNAVPGWSEERLVRLVDASQGTRLVVKTHGPPDRFPTGLLCNYLGSGDVRIHVVYRDARDTVLSMLDEAALKPDKDKARTVDEAIERLRLQLRKLRHWGSFPSLKLLYDDFAFDARRGPELIASDLGVAVDPNKVWKLVDERHTRKRVAQPARHRTEMSPEDADRVAAAFPDYQRLVGEGDLGWFERAEPVLR
jgi:hypothetical protein